MSPIDALIDAARPYAWLILPVVFLGFFAVSLFVIRFRNTRATRSAYVGIVLGMMSLSLVGLLIAPFVPYALYSHTAPPEMETNEIRVVDTDGDTLLYDGRAAEPMTGPSLNELADDLVEECNEAYAREIGTYLLEQGRSYRDEVGDDSFDPVEALRFPRHNLDFKWTEERLEGYSRFRAIQVYHVTARPTADNSAVAEYDDRLLIEVNETSVSFTEGMAERCS